MIETTILDAAHAAMESAPDDPRARLKFYERLADGELFLLLAQEADGDAVTPEIFDVAEGRFVLAFDRSERLTRFAERPAPYVALSGRALASMLAGQGIGLGVNLEVAPSAILIPPEAVLWLAETTAAQPDEVEARIAEVGAPRDLPDALIIALDAKLAAAAGLAEMACLVSVVHQGGGRGHMLGFVGASEAARPALARAVAEALTFSGIEAGALDVGFFAADDPVSARLAARGLRFDLPVATPAASPGLVPAAPGSDPAKPPILRPRRIS